ncbi:MAG: nitroreductase family deazaflavin-dependent oxidoreductase [Deltaproteobacteria bacterium]|nr:nitroreductase family deazaflavin-dependent oxidoreductase [Deltaproteobacteria bacterium]
MRLVLRGLGILVTTVLVWYAIQSVAAESGEVVILTTTKADAEDERTRLWVVDHEGSQWLRSGSDVQGWYGNILERPEVEVMRGRESHLYTAVPNLESREVVNRLMQQKYGWADTYVGFFFSRENSIPIRLDPR